MPISHTWNEHFWGKLDASLGLRVGLVALTEINQKQKFAKMKTCQLICKSLTDISLSSCSWIIWVAVAATVISKVFAIFRLKLQIAKVSLIWILKNLLLLLHVRLYGFTTSGSGSISYFKCFCNFLAQNAAKTFSGSNCRNSYFPAQIAASLRGENLKQKWERTLHQIFVFFVQYFKVGPKLF